MTMGNIPWSFELSKKIRPCTPKSNSHCLRSHTVDLVFSFENAIRTYGSISTYTYQTNLYQVDRVSQDLQTDSVTKDEVLAVLPLYTSFHRVSWFAALSVLF